MARHPLHSICPYFAMFPENFVERHVLAFTKVGELVLDPFCGRGTTVFQSLLMNRQAFGIDINPVAACIAGAKARPPTPQAVLDRLDCLQSQFVAAAASPANEFFSACFHRSTLSEILFLRDQLDWRRGKVDRFIAAMVLGALHGESHRSQLYLSNRMPRTISTKPEYSVRWWAERGLKPPLRDTFKILRTLTAFRFRDPPASRSGVIRLADSRRAGKLFARFRREVRLVVTSPPYFDVTDYAEDQWLRLWFLGGDPFPMTRKHRDDRITVKARYWQFLGEVWKGVSPLLADNATVVIRMGGRLSVDELSEGLDASLKFGLGRRRLRQAFQPVTTEVKGRQSNNFRPGARPSVEHDFVYTVG